MAAYRIRTEIIKRSMYILIFGLVLIFLASVVTFLVNPEIKDRLGDGLETTGLSKVWDYVKNNGFYVPLQMFILALIPVQFLYLANIIVTNIALGFFIGFALRMDLYKGIGLTVASIPHTIVEIFAYCLLAAILFELNRSIRALIGNIFRKHKRPINIHINTIEMIKIYILFVLPLIVIAALVETYVADMIFQLFA